jgi:hypothetical protein
MVIGWDCQLPGIRFTVACRELPHESATKTTKPNTGLPKSLLFINISEAIQRS